MFVNHYLSPGLKIWCSRVIDFIMRIVSLGLRPSATTKEIKCGEGGAVRAVGEPARNIFLN